MNIKKIFPIVLTFAFFTVVLFFGLSILSYIIFPQQMHLCTFGGYDPETGIQGGKGAYNDSECDRIGNLILVSAPLLSAMFTIGFIYLDSWEKNKNKKSPSPKR